MLFLSLNSLSVRVPHTAPRRVLQTQTPNPLLSLVARSPGLVLRKTNGFSMFLVARSVNQWFLTFLVARSDFFGRIL